MESRDYESAVRLKNIETFREVPGTPGKINLAYNYTETSNNGMTKVVVKSENFEVCDPEKLLKTYQSLRQKSKDMYEM